ncbi:hypothetical protein ACQYRI_00365 [Salmonella enterica]
MKIKKTLFVILTTYSMAGSAAFSEVEKNQLIGINTKSKNELNLAIENLNSSVNSQINNNPKYKYLIIELKESWGEMIDKKCQLESVDSKGTDAETAEFNGCLIRNYQEETKYFNAMLP